MLLPIQNPTPPHLCCTHPGTIPHPSSTLPHLLPSLLATSALKYSLLNMSIEPATATRALLRNCTAGMRGGKKMLQGLALLF